MAEHCYFGAETLGQTEDYRDRGLAGIVSICGYEAMYC